MRSTQNLVKCQWSGTHQLIIVDNSIQQSAHFLLVVNVLQFTVDAKWNLKIKNKIRLTTW